MAIAHEPLLTSTPAPGCSFSTESDDKSIRRCARGLWLSRRWGLGREGAAAGAGASSSSEGAAGADPSSAARPENPSSASRPAVRLSLSLEESIGANPSVPLL